MNEKKRQTLANLYITMAVLGIITAIPILGNMLDIFGILTIIMFGIAIYLLAKQPKTVTKTASTLMIISCILSVLGSLIILGSVGSLTTITETANDIDVATSMGGLAFGSIMALILQFPSWVLKILAIIFSFQNASKLKKEKDD